MQGRCGFLQPMGFALLAALDVADDGINCRICARGNWSVLEKCRKDRGIWPVGLDYFPMSF